MKLGKGLARCTILARILRISSFSIACRRVHQGNIMHDKNSQCMSSSESDCKYIQGTTCKALLYSNERPFTLCSTVLFCGQLVHAALQADKRRW